MFTTITVFLTGFLLSTFLFWRRLKDDYPNESIFSTCFIVIFSGLLGVFLLRKILDIYWFWGFIFFSLFGLWASIYKNKLKFFETLDAFAPAFLSWMGLLFLKDAVVLNRVSSLIAFIVILFLLALYSILDSSYKKFSWYKSGKVGFSGLFVSGVFFGLRLVFSLYFKDMYSFSGSIEPVFSAILMCASFLLLFKLSSSK